MPMLPREYLPHRGQTGKPARHSFQFRALGLATAALLLTSCSPAVFQPAPVQADDVTVTPAFAESNQDADHASALHPDDDAADSSSSDAPPADSSEEQSDTAADAPLPALATEIKDSREAQREAVAQGAEALEAARQQHLDELAAEEQRLAEEEAEAAAEAERQRLEEEAEEEAAAAEEAEQDSPAGAAPEPAPEPEPEPEQSQAETPADAPAFNGDLNSYLDELAASYPGDISISVTELGGAGRSGSSSGAESRVSASTYKLFVAYGILSRVESGELSWDDTVDGGRDRATCLRDMISVSDNPCADVFRDEIGWEGLRDIAAETGGPATDFIPAYARTSANDLTAFLTRLESGSLSISSESRTRLLSAMEGNIFRQGIPAGSAGAVLNKVGFLDGYLNDAAIVRHPQGTYVLSIMSEGSDWGSISSITRQIEAALY